MVYGEFPCFRRWCCSVLPLVYDDTLSYSELLYKCIKYINDLIEQDKVFASEIEELKKEMQTVLNYIDNFDTEFAKSVIEKYIATMIFVEISDSGYIVYYIPEKWEDITFNTTGKDIAIDGTDYGRLVLSY